MIDPEKLADEAILLRSAYIDAADCLPDGIREQHRILRAGHWPRRFPGLNTIADDREAGVAKLAAAGQLPDLGCTVRAILVELTATPDERLPHRYRITRGDGVEQLGLAWLSTSHDGAGPGRYVVKVDADTVYGDQLAEALLLMAQVIDRGERVKRDAARGEIQ